MNRHLHTSYDYGYRRRPDDGFPERRLPEHFSSHYERDLPPTNTAIPGRGQWNDPPGHHRPELSPSIPPCYHFLSPMWQFWGPCTALTSVQLVVFFLWGCEVLIRLGFGACSPNIVLLWLC